MTDENDLQIRRAAAEKRLADAEAKRAARAKPADVAEVERLEREASEAEAIEAAEAEYGPQGEGISIVSYPRGIVIVRKPDFVAVKRFHDAGKSTLEAKDKFGRPYVVYPPREAYALLAAENAALQSAVADAAATLGGFGKTKLDEKSMP